MSKHSYIHTLKRIAKNKEIRDSKPNKDLDYLYELGYIEMTVVDKPNDYYAQPYLTEKGKAFLYERKLNRIEVWLPVAISNLIALVALVISIIALLK